VLDGVVNSSGDVGCVVRTASHLPFGAPERESGGALCGVDTDHWYSFSGRELEKRHGVYYFSARYYNPYTATWLSVDGKYLFAQSLDNIDYYTFVANNPYIYIERDGQQYKWAISLYQRTNPVSWLALKVSYQQLEGWVSDVKAIPLNAAESKRNFTAMVAAVKRKDIRRGLSHYWKARQHGEATLEPVAIAVPGGGARSAATRTTTKVARTGAFRRAGRRLSRRWKRWRGRRKRIRRRRRRRRRSGKDKVKKEPYSNVKDHPSVGPKKDFTQAQKRKYKAANRKRNKGRLLDDETGEALVDPKQSRSGVTPPGNEAHVDHYVPKSKGGSNSSRNARVRARRHNLKKSDKMPE